MQGIDDRWLEWVVAAYPVARPCGQDRQRRRLSAGHAPTAALVSAVLAWHRRWLQLGAFLGAVITSELCIGPVKALVDRPRPPTR